MALYPFADLSGSWPKCFPEKKVEPWQPGTPVGRWLEGREFGGGCDNAPALLAAWNLARQEEGSAIIWVHGPQPVELSGLEALVIRAESVGPKPPIYTLAVGIGPNRILERLDRTVDWRRVSAAHAPGTALSALLESWEKEVPIARRERVATSELAQDVAKADRHLARLWGREEVERLRKSSGKLDAAVKLASALQLVTPVTGAVVLETKQQYDRHGLTPVGADTVPTIPEPGTAVLMLAATSILALHRRRARS
jgi:hypothetical protein